MSAEKNNIDPAEIAKFDALAQEWWDPDGPMKPLHDLNPHRLSYVMHHSDIQDKKVLDIGCGAGILTESLAASGALATGLDLSPSAIAAAKQHAETNDIAVNYTCTATETYATTHKEQFDVITCMEMLEHVPDPASIIQSAVTMLKPGGSVFFSTINRNPKAFLSAIVGAEYILRLLPRGTHEYHKFIRPSELRRWATAADLTLQDMKGITYHPLQQTFSLTDNVDINYLIYFTKAL